MLTLLGFRLAWFTSSMREADQADRCVLVAVAPLSDLAKELRRSARAASNGQFYSLLNSAFNRNHLVPLNSTSSWVKK